MQIRQHIRDSKETFPPKGEVQIKAGITTRKICSASERLTNLDAAITR